MDLPPPSSGIDESAQTPDDFYSTESSLSKLWAKEWLGLFRHGAWCSGEPPPPRPIQPMFDNYHPYACNACKRGPFTGTNLMRCTRCRVIRYCCREHQKGDWKEHKKWCAAFVASKEEASLKIAGDNPSDLESWRLYSKRVTTWVANKMGARLHSAQSQMVAMQPRCRKCFSAAADGADLVTCPRCHGVALCRSCADGGHVEDSPAEERHLLFHSHGGGGGKTTECDGHILALACIGMVVEQGNPLCVESDTDCESIFQPRDWAEYLHRKRGDFKDVPEQPMMLMAPVVAFVTDGLSVPLTIHHALGDSTVMGKQDESACSRLVVHLLGASANEEMAINKYIELIRLNPALTYLRIVTIGPDLETVANGFPEEGRPLNFTSSDESPIRDGCDARVIRRAGCYHEVASSLETPTIIIACHPGIHDQVYSDSWRPTLDLLTAMDVPCVFTGYNKKECQEDERFLIRCGVKVVVRPSPNPFRGLRPFLDPMRDPSDFIYSNSHYFATRGCNA